jgi:AAA+ superfamily predicted ATPase
MATAEQLKSLIKAHFKEEPERFFTIALQVAAHEAQQGHISLAHDIRGIVDKARSDNSAKILKFPVDLESLVIVDNPDMPKLSLVIPGSLKLRIDRIITEYRQQERLKAHGLTHRRKILLAGSPGTGKTMTARVLAHELRLALHTVQMHRLVTKFMGESSAKLRQVFDLMQEVPGVYLFDEFDAVGGERSLDNDVGEMRRVLNSFLQFIEQDRSDSLIVAATNNPTLLDRALFRRFDDVLYYELPDQEARKELMANILSPYISAKFKWPGARESEGLNHAELDSVCRDAIKLMVLSNKEQISSSMLSAMLKERQAARQGRKG